jgi:hypothetical protein
MFDFRQFAKFEISDLRTYLVEKDDYVFYKLDYTDGLTGERKYMHATSGILRKLLKCIFQNDKHVKRILKYIERNKYEILNETPYNPDAIDAVVMRMLFDKLLHQIVGNEPKIINSSTAFASVAIKIIEYKLYKDL